MVTDKRKKLTAHHVPLFEQKPVYHSAIKFLVDCMKTDSTESKKRVY